MSARLLGTKQHFNEKRLQLAESLRSTHCSSFVISLVLAACMRKLITACVRKNKCTARMLANACKDHLIPLLICMSLNKNSKYCCILYLVLQSTATHVNKVVVEWQGILQLLCMQYIFKSADSFIENRKHIHG